MKKIITVLFIGMVMALFNGCVINTTTETPAQSASAETLTSLSVTVLGQTKTYDFNTSNWSVIPGSIVSRQWKWYIDSNIRPDTNPDGSVQNLLVEYTDDEFALENSASWQTLNFETKYDGEITDTHYVFGYSETLIKNNITCKKIRINGTLTFSDGSPVNVSNFEIGNTGVTLPLP